MQPILIVVTAIALAMAAGMAVVVVTMLRHERARSDARIEALSALAAETGPAPEPVRASTHFPAEQVAQWREAVRPSGESAPPLQPVHRSSRIIAEPAAMHETPPIGDDEVDDFEIRTAVAGVADLFAEPERPSPWANRLVAIGCFAAIVVALAIGVTTFAGRGAPTTETTPVTTGVKAKSDVAPLVLLSLHHSQE